ncbi:MAG: M1 family peptidase, partial [Pyrinomonadaceae bacterium]
MSKFSSTIAIGIFLLIQSHFGVQKIYAQTEPQPPSRQEILRGSITPERDWWDLQHYHLAIEFFPDKKTIKGSNEIVFKTLKAGDKMQIDLQKPLEITKVTHGNEELKFEREGNVYWVSFANEIPTGVEDKIMVFYEGRPTESKNPPWEGGVTWGHDDLGNDFIVTTAQGIGASIWWANKDHGYDEPDRGMNIDVTVPENLAAVSNGRLKNIDENTAEKTKAFHWEVKNPINNYGVNVNIGNYV